MTALATTECPINDLIANRWSPFAFEDRFVSEDDLRALFEAARWAPPLPMCSRGAISSLRETSRKGFVNLLKASPAKHVLYLGAH